MCFLESDEVPSEAAYSRMITTICKTYLIENMQESLLLQAITKGFISEDCVEIDTTHFEARDQAPVKEEKPKVKPQKRGGKSKVEREQWLIEQAA